MFRDGFVVRVAGSLGLAGVLSSFGGCGDEVNGLGATTRKVTVTGDGYSAQPAAPVDGPSPRPIVEPTADRGEVVWSVDVTGAFVDALTASNDHVFVSTGPSLTALGVADGQQRWRQQDIDVGALRPLTEVFEYGVRTQINRLAVGDVLAAGAVEWTREGQDPDIETSYRSALITFDPATGAPRWRSKAMTGRLERVVVVDDVVIAATLDVGQSWNAEVWVFDAATGAPRWRTEGLIAGAGDDTVFVYQHDACLLHALALNGGVRWSLPMPPLQSENVPVKVVPDGDGVIVTLHYPDDAPVVVGRVDAVTGVEVWRFQLPPTGSFGGVDVAVEGTSLRVAVKHVYQSAPGVNDPPLIDVFDLDPRTGVERWAIQIPRFEEELTLEESLERYPFSTETSLHLVPMGSTMRISTNSSLSYVLGSSDGAVTRLFDLQSTMATVVVGASREMFMRTTTLPDGVVASAGSTIALIR